MSRGTTCNCKSFFAYYKALLVSTKLDHLAWADCPFEIHQMLG